MTVEHRTGAEFRIAGRTLTGTVLRYGDISPEHAERFLPGAFGPAPSAPLNIQHDRNMVVLGAGDFVLSDTPRALEIRAELPAGSAALSLVRRGALNGYSVEFHARAERREAGIRVIEQAALVGIGLVDHPSYLQSKAEVRARSGRTMSASIPTGKKVACECASGNCSQSLLVEEAFEEMWAEVFTEGARRSVGAYLNDYRGPLASTSRGTLRGRIVGPGDYQVDIDLPDSEVGRELLAAWDSAGLIVRPFIRDIQGEVIDGVQHVTGGRLGAFIVSSTDANAGWPPPTFAATPEEVLDEGRSASVVEAARDARRRRLWLR